MSLDVFALAFPDIAHRSLLSGHLACSFYIILIASSECNSQKLPACASNALCFRVLAVFAQPASVCKLAG